jgi:hypothetical protein
VGVCASAIAGYGMAVIAFVGYVYHITGTFTPTALYYAANAPPAFGDGVIVGLAGQLLDRHYGLLPIAPIFVVALIGMRAALRERPATLLFAAAAWLSLAIPVAAHGWDNGSTPLRQLVAVVPLATVPAYYGAQILTRRGRFGIATLAILAAVSLQNAWSYDLHHLKYIGRMADVSISGWKPALLFSIIHDGGGLVVAAVWIAALIVVALAGERLGVPTRSRSESRSWMGVVGAIAILALIASAAGAAAIQAGAPASDQDYLTPPH